MEDPTGPALPTGVTLESLREAVAASRSWRGVLRRVGLTSPRHGRQMRQACDDLGISYGHFGNRRFDDDALARAVASASSWPEVLDELGYAQESGSARTSLRAHCARLGIDVNRLTQVKGPSPGDVSMAPQPARLRDAGSLLVAAACTLAGHTVSWPMEPALYDLLVDAGAGILRVQVKTTTAKVDGSWMCKITRSEYSAATPGGKRSVVYDPDDVDCFGIVDGNAAVYLIPVAAVAGRTALSLRAYEAYRAPALGSPSGPATRAPSGTGGRGDRT